MRWEWGAHFTEEILSWEAHVLARARPHLGVCLSPSPTGSQASVVSSHRGRAEPLDRGVRRAARVPRVTAPSPSLQDKEVTEILAMAGNVVTLTIIPTVIYEHMVKR